MKLTGSMYIHLNFSISTEAHLSSSYEFVGHIFGGTGMSDTEAMAMFLILAFSAAITSSLFFIAHSPCLNVSGLPPIANFQ